MIRVVIFCMEFVIGATMIVVAMYLPEGFEKINGLYAAGFGLLLLDAATKGYKETTDDN